MAKQNKNKEYAIRYLSDTMKMNPDTIAKELGIKIDEVLTVLGEAQEPAQENNDKSKTSKSHSMMIRHTSNKKSNNVSIMTEGASQYNDSMRDKIKSKQSRSFKDGIFKPRNG